MVTKKLKWLAILAIVLTMILGCSKKTPRTSLEDQVHNITLLLVEGNFQQVYQDYFSKNLKKSMELTDLIQLWEQQTETSGEYIDIDKLHLSERDGSYKVAEIEVAYTDATIHVRMTFNQTNKLAGLHISSDNILIYPDELVEEEVIIGEGTPNELEGILTLPKEYQGKLPAVVLVHGSGPSDKDESVYAYKPFQDLAWGLAEQGIAVLRYDKRTFVYRDRMSVDEMRKFTVYEETIEDAILAGELLMEDHHIDSDKIYVIGHSLGGMLAPRIVIETDVFAGFVSLAGSPRPLWEIIYDQNITALESILNDKERKRQQQMIEKQYEKAQQIEQMTIEETLDETVFGISAYYFKEMDQYDPEKLALGLDIPILMLQGEDDFQVDIEKDFGRWLEVLQGKENVKFISYPGLNHFFIRYDGPNKGTINEYNMPGSVEPNVINDIADWILGNSL